MSEKPTKEQSNNQLVIKIVHLKKQVWKNPKSEQRIFIVFNEDKTKEATAIGSLPEPHIGARYKLTGKWVWYAQRNCYQFIFDKAELDVDLNEEGVVNFLKTEIKGIGESRAKDLYAVYGVKTIEVLRDKPDEVWRNFKGFTQTAAYKISEFLKQQYTLTATKQQLYQIGLTAWEVNKIIEKFGNLACDKLREDCFQLTEIKGFGWHKVSKIADSLQVPKDDPQRIRAAIIYAIEDLVNGGHVCVYGHEIIEKAQQMIGVQHLNISSGIQKLIDDGMLHTEETDAEQVIEDQQVADQKKLDEDLNTVYGFN